MIYHSSLSSAHVLTLLWLRPQAKVHRYPHDCSARGDISKRILLISLSVEATAKCMAFSILPHFDVTHPMSPSVLSCNRFIQDCQFFVRHS